MKSFIIISLIIFATSTGLNQENFLSDINTELENQIVDLGNLSNDSLRPKLTSKDPDVDRSIIEIIRARGLKSEVHFATTTDGYILKLFRIVTSSPNNKTPVLFMHGLGDSSDSWLANSDNLSHPFLLNKQGYDVWLGNNRGNKHSNTHTSLNPATDKNYWKFSMHEFGLLDLPATINYIKQYSPSQQITYIGHSQGGSQFFILCSLDPAYCSKNIKGMIGLGAASYIDNSITISIVMKLHLDSILKTLGITNIMAANGDSDSAIKKLCLFSKSLCNIALFFIADERGTVNNDERINVFYSHYPAGMATQTLEHFAHIYNTKRFCRLDNSQDYPVEKINVPMYFSVGKTDRLVNIVDAKRLKNRLNSNFVKSYIEYESMGHLTFFLDVGKSTFTNDIIKQVNEINK